ncbi:anti-sigma factor antagonist [Carbonactinospora thermoautotrophica]|uniref:STAS domain-containing protein n=1 Tax=Carbonactinospora thermoautotrophica TaxID=1469144 RepID=UPI00226E4F29|nr:STAS domain-containing protein [Carbonactinospora thermoautotrophica]MCX9193389.1 anti-sigma factor antagonist [Carbonactinospora thermoautotrophica]
MYGLAVTRLDHAEGQVEVAVTGEIDIAAAATFREQLRECLASGGPRLVVDLSGVRFCHSLGLAALLTVAEQARQAGGWVRVSGPQPQVRELFDLTGVSEEFGLPASPGAPARGLAPAA